MTTSDDNLQILSQTDLVQAQRMQQSAVRSESNLPRISSKSELSSNLSNEDKGENISTHLESENRRLLEIISMEKDKNEALAHELNNVTKDLNVKIAHLNKIVIEKQKIRDDLFYIKQGYEKVQQQRNKLLVETGHMRNQINSMQGTIFVQTQQIQIFQNGNAKLIDELNYQREVLVDYKQQNAMFKGQLKNISSAFVSLKEFLTSQREKQLQESKKSINDKIHCLRVSSEDLKSELKLIEAQQRTIDDYKSIVFSFATQIEEINVNLRTQLNFSKSFGNNFDDSSNISALLAVREEEYRKTFAAQEEQIMTLSFEIASLKKYNAELLDDINHNPQVVGRRIHSNTQYISRMMKENQREINEINQIMDVKDQQINRLKEQLEVEQSSSKSKSQQIERLRIKSNVQQNNKYTELVDQIDQLSSEKVRLNRRIEQLSQTQHTLKNQICEKDRIIMGFVEKTKLK